MRKLDKIIIGTLLLIVAAQSFIFYYTEDWIQEEIFRAQREEYEIESRIDEEIREIRSDQREILNNLEKMERFIDNY